MGSVPFALCSILYTKPFGDSLGLKRKKSQDFFQTPASPPSGRCAGGPTRRSPVGSPPGSGPLCSLLYAYILNLLGILGVSRKKFQNFFSDSRLSAFRTMRRRQGSTNGNLRTSSRRCRPNASPQSAFRPPSGLPGALCLSLP